MAEHQTLLLWTERTMLQLVINFCDQLGILVVDVITAHVSEQRHVVF